MAKQKESRLQAKIVKALRAVWPDSFWFKVHGGPYQSSGIPDLIGCVDGLFFALEVKRPGKKATLIQLETIGEIGTAGGHAYVVTTPEQAVEYVRLGIVMREEEEQERWREGTSTAADRAAMQRRVKKMTS